MKLRTRSLAVQGAVIGALLAALVTLLVVALIRANAAYEDAGRLAQHSGEVLAETSDAERLLIDLQTGVRGYTLTGERRYLAPWIRAHSQVDERLHTLRMLVRDNPSQELAAQAISSRIDAYRDYMQPATVTPPRPAAHRDFFGADKRQVDDLRGRFTQFIAVERGLAVRRQAEAGAAATRADRVAAIGLAGALLAVLLLAAGVLRAVVVPLRRLTDAVGAFTRGERDVRVPEDGRGELAALGRSFNELAGTVSGQERELRAREERYRDVVDHIDEVIFRADLSGRWLYLSAAWERLTGHPTEDVIGQPAVDFVHAGDRVAHVEAFAGLIRGEREELEIEHRWVDLGGRVRHVAVQARLVPGEQAAIAGIMRDVTARHEAERAAREHVESLDAVSRVARVLPTDGDVRLAICEAAREVSGATFAALAEPDGDALEVAVTVGADLPPARLAADATTASGRAYVTGEPFFVPVAHGHPLVSQPLLALVGGQSCLYQPVLVDGQAVAVLAVVWSEPVANVSDRQAAVIGLLALEAATALQRAERVREVHALADTDGLTGLHNRRAWDLELSTRVAGAAEDEAPLVVGIIDLDHFKAFNDTHGHQAGDRLLKEAAAAWKTELRGGDLLARYGGEEFGLVAPGCTADDALGLAERLRAVMPAGQTCSVGLAEWDGCEDADALVARADAALYEAKRSGRDRVVLDAADGQVLAVGRPNARAAAEQRALNGMVREPAVERALAIARELLGMDLTFFTEMAEEQQVFHAFAGDPSSFGLAPGTTVPVQDGYCRRMLDGEAPSVVPDVSAEPALADLEITEAGGIGAYVGVPLCFADGRVYGTLCGISHAANPALHERDAEFLRVLGRILADQLERERLREVNARLRSELSGTEALLAALNARDRYSGEHSDAVVELARAVAARMALSDERREEVGRVALLHDIGKVGIPDAVLHKPGPLDDAEWEVMRTHPVVGATIIADIESLAHLAPAVRAEHERWDGRGYPDGLAGEAIPLDSRIVLACDAYHAMTSDRPYRKALERDHATAELRRHAGTQFDPAVVEALLAVLEEAEAAPRGPATAAVRPTAAHGGLASLDA